MTARSARDLRRSLEGVLGRLQRLHSPLSQMESRLAAQTAIGFSDIATIPLKGDLAALARQVCLELGPKHVAQVVTTSLLSCSVLASVGPRLEALNALLGAELSGDGGGVSTSLAAVQTLTYSLCLLYGSCCHHAIDAPLSPEQAQQLGRGALLLVGTGKAAFQRIAAAWPVGLQRTELLREHSRALLFGVVQELWCTEVTGDDGEFSFPTSTLVGQVPPEQALALLAAIAEAVGAGTGEAAYSLNIACVLRARGKHPCRTGMLPGGSCSQ